MCKEKKWRRGFFWVRTNESNPMHLTDGEIAGPIAIHRDVKWKKYWVVTHLPSGWRIFRVSKKSVAKSYGELMLEPPYRNEMYEITPENVQEQVHLVALVQGIKQLGGHLDVTQVRS